MGLTQAPVSSGGYRKFSPTNLKKAVKEELNPETKEKETAPDPFINLRLDPPAPDLEIGYRTRRSGRKKPSEEKRKHLPSKGIEKRKLISVLRKVDAVARKAGIKYAVIGGAAFKLHGIKYPVKDIDISAMKPLPAHLVAEAGWEIAPGNPVNPNDNGHYIIDGVKVDWMFRLDDGSGKLFERAIRQRQPYELTHPDKYRDWSGELLDGEIPVAPVEEVMAIKVNAGRQKDIAVFFDFIKKGWVEPSTVLELIDKYVEE